MRLEDIKTRLDKKKIPFYDNPGEFAVGHDDGAGSQVMIAYGIQPRLLVFPWIGKPWCREFCPLNIAFLCFMTCTNEF